MPWLWVVDPPAETISVRALTDGAWRVVREVVGAETLELEPFLGVPVPLGRLWLPPAAR